MEMSGISRADKMAEVHSDIRGPVFIEATKMMAEGIDVLRLNTGNPATFGFGAPESVRKALLEHVDEAVGYCDSRGMPAARKAIAEYHRSRGVAGVELDDIYIGNGVSELVSIVTTALINEGDEVLVPMPDYSIWSNTVHIAGGKPVFYVCDEQADWYPDIDDIRSKITSRTKAMVIINPNNPTGAVYPKSLLNQMLQIAREHHLVVFSDEIYDRLIIDDVEHVPTASLAPDLLVVTLNGLSKSHLICGFRCGWMLFSGDKSYGADFIAGVNQLASMRLCGNALAQLVIPAALGDPESTRSMLVPGGRLYEQREATCRELDQIPGLTYVRNRAAFYIFPKLDVKRFNITDDQQFALDFLHSKHVMIIPGRGFNWPDPDHFRIVMLPDPDRLARAMHDLGDFLATYRQK